MPKPTDIRLLAVTASTTRIAYRAPIKFGGRVVTDAVLLDVRCEVETRAGRRGVGLGSMPLGNVWAWPSGKLTAEQTLAVMKSFGEEVVTAASEHHDYGHPLEITHHLAKQHAEIAQKIEQQQSLPEAMPRLAQLVAASPLEAAIYDAYGKALDANAYNLLGPEFVNADLATYLGPQFAGEFLDRYTLRQPKPRIPLYHLVGALDPLSPADVTQPIGDGLPETLHDWILQDGLTHLKIKLNGDDLAWDVARVTAIEHVSVAAKQQLGRALWNYSLDFNERCANVEYVLEFLSQVKTAAPAAYDRVQYIEQPTHRDLRENPENRMHAAAALKPVVIDESLIDLESLLLARELGYSGVALKACKGHSEALLTGAAAQKFNLFLCVQDLTCPGASFLHSASLAARIPNVAAIEGNGRQYCPAGNAGWSEGYPTMFRLQDGTVETGVLTGNGLGF